MLSNEQIERFWQDGYLTVPNAVTDTQLEALRRDFAGWVELSRRYTSAFGETLSGRPRFDLEPGHSPERPALRRIASPTELSEHYLEVATNSAMVDMVAALIGPDLRFHHAKINSKLPGAHTRVQWHQDFAFDPHSNDDMVTALLFLDEVNHDNGPLRVVPGSHRGPLYSLWHEGRFTGAVDEKTARALDARAVEQTGAAGTVCLMHVRTCHASARNASRAARTLFICAIAAADAVPLAPNAVPSAHEGMLLRGTEPGRIRTVAFDVETPALPKGASFFGQQAAEET